MAVADRNGLPVSVCAESAAPHEVKLAMPTLLQMVVPDSPQNFPLRKELPSRWQRIALQIPAMNYTLQGKRDVDLRSNFTQKSNCHCCVKRIREQMRGDSRGR
jgi:hypothetical protein